MENKNNSSEFWLRQIGYTFIPFVMVGINVCRFTQSKAKGIIAGIISLFLLVGFLNCCDGDPNKNVPDPVTTPGTTITNNHIAVATQKVTQETTVKPTTKPTPKPTETKKIEYILGNGNYYANEDFAAGRYDIIAIEGNGNVISDNSFNGGINAIMGVKNDGFYEKEYKNIELPSDSILTISGVKIKLIKK
jgi:hypothetical protein